MIVAKLLPYFEVCVSWSPEHFFSGALHHHEQQFVLLPYPWLPARYITTDLEAVAGVQSALSKMCISLVLS